MPRAASSKAAIPATCKRGGNQAVETIQTGIRRWQVGADYCWQEPSTGASGVDIELFEPDHREELLLETDRGAVEGANDDVG